MPSKEAVRDLFARCTSDADNNRISVQLVRAEPYSFSAAQLERVRHLIEGQLRDLPSRFERGAPYSYGMFSKDSVHWTDDLEDVDKLFALGMATNHVLISDPKSWSQNPDGLPLILVNVDSALPPHAIRSVPTKEENPPLSTSPLNHLKATVASLEAAVKKSSVTSDQEIAQQVRELAIKREGNTLSVPAGLSLDVAISALQRQKEDESREVDVIEDFDLTLPEGALALYLTLNELYGFVDKMTTPGTFWTPEKPPLLMNVQTSPTTRVTIPWGRFGVPGVEGYIETRYEMRNGFPYFQLKAHVKGRSQGEVRRLSDAIRAREDHFYQGAAIRVTFPDPRKVESMAEFFPTFLTLPEVNRDQLIFSDDVDELVDVALFTPIVQTTFCRERGIPLKRGILLEGPYGVGKTLAVNVAAGLCQANGWTFIELKSVEDLARAYQFALRHQPALIFCEDIDEVLQDEDERTSEINAILNSVDGIESKNSEIMTVFTTNDVGALTKAMLRPGRIDTVVPVRAPDARAAQRLIRLYAGDTLAATEDLSLAGTLLAGHNAAVVREVVNRSKLSAVRRISASGQTLTLIARDIELAARQMEAHSRLIQEDERDERSDIEKAADILGTKLLDAARRTPVDYLGDVGELGSRKSLSQAAE